MNAIDFENTVAGHYTSLRRKGKNFVQKERADFATGVASFVLARSRIIGFRVRVWPSLGQCHPTIHKVPKIQLLHKLRNFCGKGQDVTHQRHRKGLRSQHLPHDLAHCYPVLSSFTLPRSSESCLCCGYCCWPALGSWWESHLMEVGRGRTVQQWMVTGGFAVQIIPEGRVDMPILLHSGLLQTKANTCNSTILLSIKDGKSKQAKGNNAKGNNLWATKAKNRSQLPDVDPCLGSTLDSVHRKLAPIKKETTQIIVCRCGAPLAPHRRFEELRAILPILVTAKK